MPALQSYPINFTDPLSGEFLVAPFTSNGSIFPTIFFPLDATAISADTSLLIYGKGHPNYGERIQEDLIHLLENFYGATEPVHAVSGQLWFASVHYWQDTVGSTFYRFDDPTQTWIIITPTTSPTPPPGPIDGDHWFEPGSLTLSIWNADFSAWQPRLYITQTTMPIDGANFPDKQLLVCHNKTTLAPESQSGEGFTSRWKRAGGITVSSVPPAGPQTGDLWFDTTIPQQLKIFDGVSFVSVADRYVLKSGDTMTGFLVLNADPTNSLHAATKQYVDNVVAADIAFTPAGGISSTNVQAAIEELDTSINTPTQTVLNGKVDLSGANTPMTGFLFLSADPMLPLHAATKQYVDTFISGADGTVVSGTLNPALVGADLQLNLSIGGPIFVTGFAEATHGHTATDITFTPVGDISSTNVQAAIEEVDNKNSFARVTRSVITTTVAATYITIPPYFVATNTLWIYLNGIKQIAGQRGSQTVSLSSTSISNPTGLSDEIIGVVSGLAGTGSFDVATDRSALYTTGLSIEVLGSIGNDGTYTVMAPGSTFDFPIVGVVSGLAGTGSFDISGDFTTRFITGYVFTVSGSTGNDGTYTVRAPGSAFALGITTIPVVEAVPSAVADGIIVGTVTIIPVIEAVPSASISGDLAATYTATVAVDGGAPQLLSVNGTVIPTYIDLVTFIIATLVGSGPIFASDGITIVSDTTGPLSSILITDGALPLFGSLVDFSAIAPAVAGFAGAYQEGGTEPIVGVVSGLAGTGSFDISGDFTTRFITGYVFTVSGSTGNDGTYTVRAPGSAFALGITTIPVVEAVPSAVADGNVNFDNSVSIASTTITFTPAPGAGFTIEALVFGRI